MQAATSNLADVTFPASEPPRSDVHSVRRLACFYKGPGSRMFDASFLSRDVARYLAWETRRLGAAVQRHEIDHLVELGCGTGRHLEFAELQGCAYDGVDLVAEMIQIARASISPDATARCRVHVGACEALRGLVGDRFSARSLALYPFNFLGNVADPERALAPVRAMGGRALVSFFQPTPRATAVRSAYYERILDGAPCVARTSRGVLFTSTDGFKSLGFEGDYLASLFARAGFRAAEVARFEDIAWMYLLEPA